MPGGRKRWRGGGEGEEATLIEVHFGTCGTGIEGESVIQIGKRGREVREKDTKVVNIGLIGDKRWAIWNEGDEEVINDDVEEAGHWASLFDTRHRKEGKGVGESSRVSGALGTDGCERGFQNERDEVDEMRGIVQVFEGGYDGLSIEEVICLFEIGLKKVNGEIVVGVVEESVTYIGNGIEDGAVGEKGLLGRGDVRGGKVAK